MAKLLETGLVNMSRVETWWVVVTSHLLEDCSHPHIRMREWSAEAVCVLIQVSTGLGSQVPDPAAVFSVGTISNPSPGHMGAVV